MNAVTRKTKALVMIAMAAMLPLARARADILPVVNTPTVTPVAGGFNWTYDIMLSGAQQLLNGNSFTIYDFGPGILVSMPGNWTSTTSAFAPLNGTSSNGTATPIQTDALNWTFTWNDGTVSGPLDLGSFVIFSTSGTSQSAAFMGLGTDQITLRQNANITNTLVPTAAPEPGTLVLFGSGMLGLVGIVRRRRKA